MQVNMHEAKTHLSRLVERAVAGEEVILAKAGKPVARIVALVEEKSSRREPPAHWKGQVKMSDDFDAYDAVIEGDFEASEIFPR